MDCQGREVEIKYTKIFIDNQWHKAENGKTFSVINPSTGEEICQVEEATRVFIDAFNDRIISMEGIVVFRLMWIKQLKLLEKLSRKIHRGVN